jgi:DNA mismatch repair protein MutL
MPTIQKLKPEIVAKIAAGEVAERPATILKELIENSLDAKAEHIDIFLSQGGLKTIVIRDDGHGMIEDDLLLSYLPHTTSKIFEEQDLYRIGSFGFRGEALASIATVSEMSLKSRALHESRGYYIEIDNGKRTHQEPVGMPIGTEIRIENLFAKTPARKKFLGDAKTELRAITEIITRFALVFPGVGFTLSNDSYEFINLPSGETYADRIHELLGVEMRDHSISLEYETDFGKISGFIGKPQIATKATTNRYIFVNKRPVASTELGKLVTENYGSLIEPRTFAPHVIFLELPFESVDVNIHPRKEEVAFANAGEVKKLISQSIQIAFEENDLTYHDPTARESLKPGMDGNTADILKEIVTPWFPNELPADEIAQIHNTYLIAQTSKGLIIADQHAAHERILFEQFKEALMNRNAAQYILPEPLIFELSFHETLALEQQIDILNRLGFSLELFGARTFKLSSVPDFLKERDYKKHILEVLHDIEHGTAKTLDRETERTLAYLACRSAIKACDPLAHAERKRLIEKLLESNVPYTCPHGRPTHIELSSSELDRMFKRK